MFSTKTGIRLLNVNFSAPWWRLITCQKSLVVSIAVLTMVPLLFWSISPFLVTYAYDLKSAPLCLALFLVWLIINFAEAIGYKLNARFQLQIIHSVYYNAHRYLLTVDPHYHIHRSSGTILGKIDRAARGFEDLLDQILLEFSPLLIGLVTTIVVLSYYSLLMTVVVSVLFLVIIVFGSVFACYLCRPSERKFILTDDAFRRTAVENLAQVQLVRATFASDYINEKLKNDINNNMHSEERLWLSYTFAHLILRTLYLIALFVVLGTLFLQVREGTTSVVSATALAIAYMRNTQLLLKITSPFRRFMRGGTAVKDLFDFIPKFGKQNFPVLGDMEKGIEKSDLIITLEAAGIYFDYGKAQLFNAHNFSLHCSKGQANKLYGIIGASGSGKTTLLSILGGQLKPILGSVFVDKNNIYEINDECRRHLIALQGQMATTLQGTVRYNLLFGLPSHHGYSDNYLLEILQRVGLQTIFEANDGLNSELGERGLNLSGGQRQRLNFASLYLRASFYRPAVILIDEPTSSLDEISEGAITAMIKELARDSITLVIAHRLKTIEDAAGIIDLSLLQEEKSIAAYSSKNLYDRSLYYQQLIKGVVRLDNV